ncbi:MAG: hypothetical protein HDR29_08585 [Lachnospiraceae bacterium]|nr:hypothetical protein [Lachnospiraceae bacterium]
MNYEEFKEALQKEIQSRSLKHMEFTLQTVTKTNEVLEGLAIRFEGQAIAPTIYPQRLYQTYKKGMPVSDIVDFISPTLFDISYYPPIPEFTLENAEKSISFSLINKDKNKELLEQCPYKEVHDMAAIPKWHITDEASFVVNNNVMQKLRLTKEEVFDIAKKNTESASYVCKRLDDMVRDILLNDGIDEDDISEIIPMGQSHLYIISNPQRLDGSRAILSDSFMQKTAEQIGTDELYLLPSSRNEMLVIDSHIADSAHLKSMVMEVNSDPNAISNEDFLSNSIYKYDAKTNSISMCDNKGLFHDKEIVNDAKPNISKGGRGKC